MSSEIPDFPTAVSGMTSFLQREGHPTQVGWVFREDIWKGPDSVTIRMPWPRQNETLAAKVFEEGRAKGLVGITALAIVPGATALTVWFPKYAEEEVQGWSVGLKLTIAIPLLKARTVPSLLWPVVKLVPSYRRYQALEHFVGTRDWAAA